MPIQAFLTGKAGQPSSLGRVAVVFRHEHDLEIEATQPNESEDVVEADRRAAGLPSGYGGLCCAGPDGKLRL